MSDTEYTREQRALIAFGEMAKEDPEFAERFYYALGMAYLDSEELELLSQFGKLVRKHGATTRKEVSSSGDYMRLLFDFSDNGDCYTHIGISVRRDAVCTRRVVGTRQVEKLDYLQAPKVMVTEEIVEWDCGSVLQAAVSGENDE